MRLLRSKAAHAVLAALLLGVFLMQLALSIRHQSQTYDEGFHLVAGYRYWQCGDFGINSEHPPLMKWVAAAPLWFGHDPAPDGVCGKEPTTKDHGYALAVGYLFGQVRNGDALLYRGRMAESLFALVLGVACFLFARELFGPGGGADRAPATGIRAHDPCAWRLDHDRHCGHGLRPGLGLCPVLLLPQTDQGTPADRRHSHRAYLCLQAFRRVDRAHPDRA